jgi:phage gp46-like protein
MDIAIGSRSASSGRFNFVIDEFTGDVKFDDTEAHAVLTVSAEERGSYAFDSTWGSDLHTLKNLTSRTPSQAEAMELAALDPMVKKNVISGVQVAATTAAGALGRLELDVAWTTPTGQTERERVEV